MQPIFSIDPIPSYSITQAFTTGLDIPYKAVIGAVKAACARSIELEEDEYSFALPIVVFEGRLFECSLVNNCELQIKEIYMGTIHWRSGIGRFTHPRVSIVNQH